MDPLTVLETHLKNHLPHPMGPYVKSSVLVPFIEIEKKLHILFCQRSFRLKSQPGDICFPGGRAEQNETPLQTALRETQEEIGISHAQITVIGQPDYVVTLSGRIITPFIGRLHCSLDDLKLQKTEVETVFTVPLSFFLTTSPQKSYVEYHPAFPEDFPFDRIVGGRGYHWADVCLPELFYEYGGYTIWGMTARITHHICQMLKAQNKQEDK